MRRRGLAADGVLAGGIAIGVALAFVVTLELVARGVDPPPMSATVEAPPAVVESVMVTDAHGLTATAFRATSEPTEARIPEPTTPLPASTLASAPAIARTSVLPAAVATATPGANRAPILQEGTTIHGLGESPIRLLAIGSEPDGEPVAFAWDFGDCLHGQSLTQFEAEVSLVRECDYAVVTLSWTDPEGAIARAQWAINR